MIEYVVETYNYGGGNFSVRPTSGLKEACEVAAGLTEGRHDVTWVFGVRDGERISSRSFRRGRCVAQDVAAEGRS